MHIAVNLFTETFMLRYQVFKSFNSFSLSHDELNEIKNYICAS